MDALWGGPQRHKRSFSEMSQQVTLSPSPSHFREGSSLFLPRSPLAAPTIVPSFLERRRTQHPHNPTPAPYRDFLDMPENSSSRRVQRVASQTIIDLTDDQEDANNMSRNRQHDDRPHRPPQLGRSDALGLRDVVDLTDDVEEPELLITGARELPAPRSRPAHPANPRSDSPSLFLPHLPGQRAPGQHALQRALGRPLEAFGNALGFAGIFGGQPDGNGDIFRASEIIMQRMNEMGQENPFHRINPLDYRTQGLGPRLPQNPDHVPPKPARENFTRSPQEDDIIICPSCDQELVHNKQDEEPVPKKGGKPPSRKEREEHSFWVVKECGHVYCNNCYQNRLSQAKLPNVNFTESSKQSKSKSTKTISCSVEACESDVKSKDRWIGIFL